jgi:hypothetical protein
LVAYILDISNQALDPQEGYDSANGASNNDDQEKFEGTSSRFAVAPFNSLRIILS